jgi:hypothetical protein
MSSEGCFRQRLSTIAASWRVLALRGLSALIFGLVILFWPGLILAVLPLSPFQRLCHGGRDNRSRARAQDLRSRREGGFHWPKERWVSSPVWWLFSGLR